METILYFFISYPSKDKEKADDIYFTEPKDENQIPKCIYMDEIYDNRVYYYKKIFMINKSAGKGKFSNKFIFEFELGRDNYEISFDSKEASFIYDVKLEKHKRILRFPITNINQNTIEYYDKMHIFINALKENNEENKIDLLYKDTIDLFSTKKDFSFLIELFVEIYKKKDLCKLLLDKFKEMNLKEKEVKKNMDRNLLLEKHKLIFNTIISEADNYNYDTIEFYGIILCYLNFYDYNIFSKIINELLNNKSKELFEILLIYNSHFKYHSIRNDFDFLNKFFKDIGTFINIIEKNKEKIFDKYFKDKNNLTYTIKLDHDLKRIKFGYSLDKNVNNLLPTSDSILPKEIEKIIKNIESIILFSKEKNAFLIYFTKNCWKYILNNFNEPNKFNIYICFKLREVFMKYYDFVNEIFWNKSKAFTIKYDANNYYELDEFSYLLDKNIKKYIINNKELENIEKLEFITKYNPYYKEKRNKYNNDINIFDLFDFNNINNEFIEDFRNIEFEIRFRDNINEYINKIFSKIKNISEFDNVLKLINIKNINKNIFLNSLTKTYNKIIKNDFEKNLENLQILARLAIIFFNYENEKNKFKFIETKIKKLDKDIIPKIFIEIMRIYINLKEKEEKDEYGEIDDIEIEEVQYLDKMKDYIFCEFFNLKEEKDIENIMSLIELFEGKGEKVNEIKDKKKKENKGITNEFLNKLIEKRLFRIEEFFSSNKSLKVLLFFKINERGILQKDDIEYYDKIEYLMRSIKQDLDGEIKKKTLDEFLIIEDSIIKKRLNLLGLIFENYNSNDEYYRLKKINKKINQDINKLIDFKNNIMIYHRETYKDKIDEIMKLIKDSQFKKIKDYNIGKLKEIIKGIEEINNIIDKVKNNLLFNVIYENMNLGNNEEEHFNNAVEKLDNIGKELKNNTDFDKIYSIKEYKDIFDKINEKLSNNEKRVQEFINYDLIKYFGITNNDLINDLNIFFKIKKYEMDINSIIFFFEFFQKHNSIWNQKINKTEFKNLFSRKENPQENEFKNIKKYLKELKDNEIYDYENIQNYNKFFICFYDKKEAIDFLLSKMGQNIAYLYDRIQPTDRTICIEDIKNTEYCISTFYTLKNIEDNFKIFIYIKNMNENQISNFEKYSKIYSSLIELDTFYDETENLYDEVKDIIKDKTFNIYQDEDDFNLEDLIHLKNKIYIKNENIDENKNIIDNFEKKQLKFKCKIMIFYKNLISNLEFINEYMKVLRMKGNILPIKIIIKTNIKDNGPSIKYYLDNRETEFKNIKSFLLNVTSNYISQLNKLYKEKILFRYLFGKQLRDIMKHIDYNFNIDSLLRFILNKRNNEIIKEGFKTASSIYDYIDQYEKYNEYSLESISNYIFSVFQNNGIALEDHFNNMKINNCKGIYLDYCYNHSMERYLLNLYWDKLGKLPIAQNILIANRETSSEEIQAFFHRAILCHYNILFIVEITDSFSDYQQSIMNRFIDNLLSDKHKYYIEETKENANIKNTEKYLDSCIFLNIIIIMKILPLF